MSKQKIAILGGGLGSMTTAFWLTNQPGWQDKYDITVYQLGWRLGGKGAAGRGPNNRIQEHGLHIWIGFYDNAFRMIQATYEELAQNSNAPVKSWAQAFTPHDFVAITENIDGKWKTWPLPFPSNPRTPGDPGEFLTLWDFIYEGLSVFLGHIHSIHEQEEILAEKVAVNHGWFDSLKLKLESFIVSEVEHSIADLLGYALKLAESHRTALLNGAPEDHSLLHSLLEEIQSWFHARMPRMVEDDERRRLFILADLGMAIARGMLTDIIPDEVNGFDKIDQLDFREWLKKYDASDIAVWSAVTKALYDLVFGYENGDPEKPNFGAGAALLSTLRIGLDYKGSIFWKMNFGMGDTIFTPFYEALSKRGVKFEFFSQVQNLGLSQDKKSIETIQIGVQATPKASYDPFVVVNELNCWPAEPLYDQLVEGEQLKAQGINLESFWTPWQNPATRVLQKGVDFDQVVLGISIASFPYVCPELLEASSKWKDMCAQVKTVGTMSMQWWLKPELKDLGWDDKSVVLDGYQDPMNTWADMSFLLAQETWSGEDAPKNLAYFCGAMEGDIPDRSEVDYPQKAYDAVKAVGQQFANESVGFLWPKATLPGNPNALDPSLLSGTFDSQYFRANVDPSERYVLSVKGSVNYRLKPDQSGFSNLFLTGDWTYNYFNAGCVEATVISGMLCSNAMTGFPKIDEIEGVRPGKWWE